MAEVLARRCDDSPQVPSAHVIQESDPGSFTSVKSTSRGDPDKLASTSKTSASSSSRIPLSSTSAARNLRSPRCEAFVMTGDKMLILNPKISPHYAKMHQAQMPPAVELYEGKANATKKSGPFDDFPSMHHHVSSAGSHRAARAMEGNLDGVSTSHSEHLIDELNRSGDLDNDETENSMAGDVSAAKDLHAAKNGYGVAKNYSVSTLPESTMGAYYGSESGGDGIGGGVPSSYDHNRSSCASSTAPGVATVTRGGPPSTDPTTKRFMTSSQSATSSPLKRQSGSTITADENSLVLGGGYAPVGTANGGGGGTVTKRRMHRGESSLSDVTTTLSMSIPRPETITRIATQLFTLQAGYTVNDVAAFLMKKDCELSQKVAAEFLQFFNFSGKRLDVALREFLNHVCLTGESSERAHLLSHFSARYFQCNPTLFNGVDEIHALACALILLNTDLHGPNLGKKMTAREFVDNLLHTQYAYDRNMLKTLYTAVKDAPFVRVVPNDAAFLAAASSATALPHAGTLNGIQTAVVAINQGTTAEKSATLPPDLIAASRGAVSTSEKAMRGRSDRKKQRRDTTLSARDQQDLAMFVNPREQVDYKRGWLLKKSVYDADGRRTPFGRRKWQMCYATLRGMALYLHKNERVFERSRHETFANCVRLHHAVAEIARDYSKRQHVFRLRTANFGELLFETSEPQEVQRWIDAINYVAAAFSTPPLPAAVSSADHGPNAPLVFRFPSSLPVAPTTLSTTEQLRAHCERLDELTEALAKLRAVAPSIKAKGRPVYDYFYRERYLDKERERYTIYVSILGEKLGAASQLDVSSLASSCATKKNSLTTNARLNCCAPAIVPNQHVFHAQHSMPPSYYANNGGMTREASVLTTLSRHNNNGGAADCGMTENFVASYSNGNFGASHNNGGVGNSGPPVNGENGHASSTVAETGAKFPDHSNQHYQFHAPARMGNGQMQQQFEDGNNGMVANRLQQQNHAHAHHQDSANGGGGLLRE